MLPHIYKKLMRLRDDVSEVIEAMRDADPVSPENRQQSSHWMHMLALFTNPVIVGWLREAGMSASEVATLTEDALMGSMMREKIVDGIKRGIKSAVFVMHHDPEVNGDAVTEWACHPDPHNPRIRKGDV
jgi:hypothetical protein